MTRSAIATAGLSVLVYPVVAGLHLSAPPCYPDTVPLNPHAVAGVWQSVPTIRAELDTNQMTIGDRLRVTVVVEHDAGTEVVWPDSLAWQPFEQLGMRVLQPVRDGNRIRAAVSYTLTAFELGDLEVPAFEVSLRDLDGVDTTTLRTESLAVSVISVGLDQSGDIRAIKGPKDMPRNWLLLLPWILATGGVVAGGYSAYRRLRARRGPEEEREIKLPARPPHEVAHDALKRLEQSGMLERGAIKEYFIEVSDIIRRYVEDRYRVDALEMASHEVVMGLERSGVTLEVRLQFERFLGDCDLVKFAKWTPEMSVCHEIVPRARKLVDDTRLDSAEGGQPREDGEALMLADPVRTAAASDGENGGGTR